ncbi:hypothetical protein SCHPADRAFT_924986 [Schizopora paradoxa]|uniref:BAG domain-containing protein n=1 Tax=Schizopora paradoxa TaxID=27342 RepID=A0A0H2SNT9_9AGAM|nr:hypothetical protein SCHPADRAFT_924986 [Schizopora paradoxa]
MMAYNFYNPSDNYYSNLFGAPRTSPYASRYGYTRNTPSYSDSYLRALADEEAARRELATAVRREQEARRKRELEQAHAQARARALAQAEAEARWRAAQEQELARRRAQAQAQARARTRARPQTMYGFPFGFAQQPFGAQYVDDDDDEEEAGDDEGEQYVNLADYLSAFAPRMGRRSRSVPHRDRPCPRTESPVHPQEEIHSERTVPSEQTSSTAAPIDVPIQSYEDTSKLNHAATKIQSAFRAHVERVAAEQTRSASLEKVHNISSKLEELRSSFTIPSTLEFDSSHIVKPRTTLTASEDGEVHLPYKLTYSPVNAPVHGYLDGLLKLLQQLDAVESGGDAQVRHERREVVKAVEAEMARVDSEVANIWTQTQRADSSTVPSATEEVMVEVPQVEEASSSIIPSATTPQVEESSPSVVLPESVTEPQVEEEDEVKADDSLASAPTENEVADVPMKASEDDANAEDEKAVDTLVLDITGSDEVVPSSEPISFDATTAQEPTFDEESSEQLNSSVVLPHPHEQLSSHPSDAGQEDLMIDVEPLSYTTEPDRDDAMKMIDVVPPSITAADSAPSSSVPTITTGNSLSTIPVKSDDEDDGVIVDPNGLVSPLTEKAPSDHTLDSDFEIL